MTPGDLATRIDAHTKPDRSPLRFSLCAGRGWVTTGDESTALLLCDLWNNRAMIATALREAA